MNYRIQETTLLFACVTIPDMSLNNIMYKLKKEQQNILTRLWQRRKRLERMYEHASSASLRTLLEAPLQ